MCSVSAQVWRIVRWDALRNHSNAPQRGLCLPNCEADTDCRSNYRCDQQYTRGAQRVGNGYGENSVGEPCRSSVDCAIGTEAACLSRTGWVNGYCLTVDVRRTLDASQGRIVVSTIATARPVVTVWKPVPRIAIVFELIIRAEIMMAMGV